MSARTSVLAWMAGTPLDPLWIAKRSLRRGLARVAAQGRGRLLDVGCGVKPYRAMFSGVSWYLGIERPGTLSRSSVIDVYADALALPFRGGSFDSVLCNEVLEHVTDPARLFAEAARVMKPGATLILSTPQTWGLHEEPFDFFRYTRYGLEHLARGAGFEVLEIRATCGTFATVGQRLASFFFYSTRAYRVAPVNLLIRIPLALGQIVAVALDELSGRRGDTIDNVLVARR
ncbi:MAG TPA: class I SAM-dependent methyltransferase [Candidatus Saccharimonadaceae bacterium]|nr:class I SAM-dependent methyltransferase [Candidatus Saccharimonadaceae bacterium]